MRIRQSGAGSRAPAVLRLRYSVCSLIIKFLLLSYPVKPQTSWCELEPNTIPLPRFNIAWGNKLAGKALNPSSTITFLVFQLATSNFVCRYYELIRRAARRVFSHSCHEQQERWSVLLQLNANSDIFLTMKVSLRKTLQAALLINS